MNQGPPLHLLDVTLFYSPTSGGVRRYLDAKHAWIRQHRAADWRHSLLVPGECELREPGGRSTLAGLRIPGTFNYRLPLDPRAWTRAIEALEPDIVEVGDAFHTAWAAQGVAARRGIPCIAFHHSNLPRLVGRRYGAPGQALAARYVKLVYSRFDRVYAPSRFMCDYLRELGIHHARHQPLGVDPVTFHPSRRVRDLRAGLGLAPEARVLLYAGRFSQEKRIDVLRDAFRRLGAPYELVLLGGAQTRQLERNVRALPYRRDPAELATWLASADALVHAGTEETFGLVVLEAMACGRPVVATRASAMPELVSEDVGLLARPGDAADLADAIAALYERDVESMGRAARARVLQQFTWSLAFATLLDGHAAMVGRGMSGGDESILPLSPGSADPSPVTVFRRA